MNVDILVCFVDLVGLVYFVDLVDSVCLVGVGLRGHIFRCQMVVYLDWHHEKFGGQIFHFDNFLVSFWSMIHWVNGSVAFAE
ncbi:MAG: hypothetical protein HXY44_01580 [Syntrophaceae bacterium]|nr:hypothetical protein [Syntrophaceae bacterium]